MLHGNGFYPVFGDKGKINFMQNEMITINIKD